MGLVHKPRDYSEEGGRGEYYRPLGMRKGMGSLFPNDFQVQSISFQSVRFVQVHARELSNSPDLSSELTQKLNSQRSANSAFYSHAIFRGFRYQRSPHNETQLNEGKYAPSRFIRLNDLSGTNACVQFLAEVVRLTSWHFPIGRTHTLKLP